MRLVGLGWMLLLLPAAATAELPVSYDRDVRPILAENCFDCHGQDSNRRRRGSTPGPQSSRIRRPSSSTR